MASATATGDAFRWPRPRSQNGARPAAVRWRLATIGVSLDRILALPPVELPELAGARDLATRCQRRRACARRLVIRIADLGRWRWS